MELCGSLCSTVLETRPTMRIRTRCIATKKTVQWLMYKQESYAKFNLHELTKVFERFP